MLVRSIMVHAPMVCVFDFLYLSVIYKLMIFKSLYILALKML